MILRYRLGRMMIRMSSRIKARAKNEDLTFKIGIRNMTLILLILQRFINYCHY